MPWLNGQHSSLVIWENNGFNYQFKDSLRLITQTGLCPCCALTMSCNTNLHTHMATPTMMLWPCCVAGI